MTKTLNALLQQAGGLLDEKHYPEASRLYQEALKLAPDNAAAMMGIAMIHNRTGQPQQALSILQQINQLISKSKAKKITASKATVLAQIGLAQQQLGRLPEALDSFRKANAIFSSPELTRHIQKLESTIQNPNSIEHLLAQAAHLQRANQLIEATKCYHAALQLNPDHPDALHGLALVLRAQKDYDGALPLIQQAIILSPDRADYFNDLGMLFQDRGELEKAVSFHKRALKVDETFVAAHINLGVAYKRLGKLDEAIAAYRQAIALQPNSPAAHNNLGNLLRIQGDLTGARKELKQAIKLLPSYQDAIENLAVVEQQGALKKAKTTKTTRAKT